MGINTVSTMTFPVHFMMNRSVMQVLYGHHPFFFFNLRDWILSCVQNVMITHRTHLLFFTLNCLQKFVMRVFIVRRSLVIGAS